MAKKQNMRSSRLTSWWRVKFGKLRLGTHPTHLPPHDEEPSHHEQEAANGSDGTRQDATEYIPAAGTHLVPSNTNWRQRPSRSSPTSVPQQPLTAEHLVQLIVDVSPIVGSLMTRLKETLPEGRRDKRFQHLLNIKLATASIRAEGLMASNITDDINTNIQNVGVSLENILSGKAPGSIASKGTMFKVKTSQFPPVTHCGTP
jgi:hypothetical protein